jgi:hypothetical protein
MATLWRKPHRGTWAPAVAPAPVCLWEPSTEVYARLGAIVNLTRRILAAVFKLIADPGAARNAATC